MKTFFAIVIVIVIVTVMVMATMAMVMVKVKSLETFGLEAQLIATKVIIYTIERAFQSSIYSVSSTKTNV